MSEPEGLWSYVHADDEAEEQRISQLARDVASQFEMSTGEKINLFLNQDAIKWGEEWRRRIDDSLASIAFFIAVLTPRYFMSAECRRELQFFARRASSLGIKELVLPLLYVDIPAVHEEEPTDDLAALVKTFQWEDWRDLRFKDRASEGYRRGVVRLAERLVEANKVAEHEAARPSTATPDQLPSKDGEEEEEDSPGFIDQLAATEEALQGWPETINAIKGDIELIGEVMSEAKGDIERADAQGKGFAGRLVVARQISGTLSEPVDRIWSEANNFASQLHQVDDGFRALVERAGVEAREDPDSREIVCKFFSTVRELSDAAHKGLSSVQQMVEAVTPLESMSRDLRPRLRRLRQGLTILVEAREVTDDWLNLIEASGVDCSEIESVERNGHTDTNDG